MRRSLSIVKDESGKLLADVPARNKAAASAALAALKTSLTEFQVIVANKDKQEARHSWVLGREQRMPAWVLTCASPAVVFAGAAEAAGVPQPGGRDRGGDGGRCVAAVLPVNGLHCALTPHSLLRVAGFPFDIPAPYDKLPALKGRAEVEMTVKLKEGRASNPNLKRGTLTIVLDGFNAPVSAGNFMDLVVRAKGGERARAAFCAVAPGLA